MNEEFYYRIKARTSLNFTLLQVNLIITFFYITIIMLFTEGYSISTEKDNYAEYGWKVWIYIPFSFYMLGSCFYALYFTSSAVNQLEREFFNIKEDNSVKIFASLFFFPFGIWWI